MMAESLWQADRAARHLLCHARPRRHQRLGRHSYRPAGFHALILFVGQVERENRGRDAFQEMDYRAFFGGMAKWVAESRTSPTAWPSMVGRAFSTAMAGRQGPGGAVAAA